MKIDKKDIYDNIGSKFECNIGRKGEQFKAEGTIEEIEGVAMLRYGAYAFYPIFRDLSLNTNLINDLIIINNDGTTTIKS